MSDLSLPPLSLVSVHSAQRDTRPHDTVTRQATTSASTLPSEAFAWPTPPYASYPSPRPQAEPEPCQIEGPNGQVSSGLLVSLDADSGIAHLQVPPARGTLALKVAQVRRITLLRPLAPLESPAPGSAAALLDHAPVSDCRLTLANGEVRELASVGHVEHALGHFLFEPVGQPGHVLRGFYPQAALASIDIGPRVGELLVLQHAATEDEVDHAAAQQQTLRQRRLGDILVTQRIVAPEQLLEAIEQQATMPMVRIGEALVALGFIDERALGDALQQQTQDRNLPLGELLVQGGVVTREELQTALARKMGYPVVDAGAFPVEDEAVLRLPLALAARLPALPLMMRGGRLVVALEDPSARIVIDEIETHAQARVVPVLARAGMLTQAIERAYARATQGAAASSTEPGGATAEPEPGSASRLLDSLEQQLAGEQHHSTLPSEPTDGTLVRLVNTMILEAQQAGVSDIHIECAPGNEKLRIRWRRDGRLRPYMQLPSSYRTALIARLKTMAELDGSERRKPQDGRIDFGRFVPGQSLELRLVTIPTANNLEDVVLRLLAPARALRLEELGLAPALLHQLRRAVERPQGLLLLAGPPGSGKTTTLHALLAQINTPERKIWTAEDPVEITQPGLRQVQVNPRIDWTFAKALRAFLQADPDVVMVGEIRDMETAQLAIEAALSGQLMLSSVHAGGATEAMTRLLDMGTDSFSSADALQAVLAQRLVRRLCGHCRVSRPASDEDADALLDDWQAAFGISRQRPDREATLAAWLREHGHDGQLQHHESHGCKHCAHTGFNGRLGLHELLLVDRDLRRLIQGNAAAETLQEAAMHKGFRTLRQDGIEKVLAGLTTIEEVRASAGC